MALTPHYSPEAKTKGHFSSKVDKAAVQLILKYPHSLAVPLLPPLLPLYPYSLPSPRTTENGSATARSHTQTMLLPVSQKYPVDPTGGTPVTLNSHLTRNCMMQGAWE